MAIHHISIRGFSLIILGMAGWLAGSHVIKSGIQTWNTPMYSPVLFMVCFLAILAGIVVWGYDVISRSRRLAETEPVNGTASTRQDMSPRENKSLMLGNAGALTSLFVLSRVVNPGYLVSQSVWLFTGVYCAVAIAGFSLFYLMGICLIFKSR